MVEELDKILQNAENLMKMAEEAMRGDREGRVRKIYNLVMSYDGVAAFLGIKALYEQNKAIIELLKKYKNK